MLIRSLFKTVVSLHPFRVDRDDSHIDSPKESLLPECLSGSVCKSPNIFLCQRSGMSVDFIFCILSEKFYPTSDKVILS